MKKYWIIGGLAGGLALAGVLALYRSPDREPLPEVPDIKMIEKIHVEVLNGCGMDGIAGLVGNRLRALGFDVLTLGNAENYNFPETIVIDRVGKPDYARLVADAIGTPNRIQQMTPDPFRIEEVTVIIGRDCAHLPILK